MENINEFLPSILNPRAIKKRADLALTQKSIVSRCSLSLKRKKGVVKEKKDVNKTFPPGKEFRTQNNSLVLNHSFNTQNVTKGGTAEGKSNFSATQELSLVQLPVFLSGKENSQNVLNTPKTPIVPNQTVLDEQSLDFSFLEDLIKEQRKDLNKEQREQISSPFSFEALAPVCKSAEVNNNDDENTIAISSDTELGDDPLNDSLDVTYELKPVVSVSFEVTSCDAVHVSTNTGTIRNILVAHKDNAMNVDCDIEESSRMSDHDDVIEISSEEETKTNTPSPNKRAASVAVNLEIKKKKSTEPQTENSKVLILNTDAIEKLSHVIVQPPIYKLLKRKFPHRNKFKNNGLKTEKHVRNGTLIRCADLKQKRIDSYFVRNAKKSGIVVRSEEDTGENVVALGGCDDHGNMSKNLGSAAVEKGERSGYPSHNRLENTSPRTQQSRRTSPVQGRHVPLSLSPRREVKGSTSEQRGPQQRPRQDISDTSSPRKHLESVQFNIASKSSTPNKNVPKNIPHYKFIAGTHFAVDAFSYGEIPKVKHYFLTHFHSDHYSGLKKSFNKALFCSKITADLCVSRLGVNTKCIQVLDYDETLTIDGIEVTAVEANHCPGAMMLVFTLPCGTTLLHTGDFRASPHMESYPVFWNKDIHTIYLDTTYCNPRYDFPTQDQCLEMALYILRQKKLAMEKAGLRFSSVLIVCGTYTIGKEKFFMGMARRVGCSVWACPEKDKVLKTVEGRSFGMQPPSACQLHVVPMRDLTHEKLRTYLDSLQGAFSEVVAFKPSGWENGKNSTVEKDSVTIHGIPYSEHSSFSEMIRFVKFLQPKQVVPTVDISGGVKSVQKYFPCPLVAKEGAQNQSRLTDYFSIQNQQHVPAVT